MKLHLVLPVIFFMLVNQIIAQQNVGVNTTSPQANLHVNGTFKLQNGVLVNGISADSMLLPGSDSLLPTQLAVKKYLKHGLFAPKGEGDSMLVVRDTFPGTDISALFAVGNLLYVTLKSANQLLIVDIGNPDSITLLGSTSTNLTSPRDITVKNGYAYVINQTSGENTFAIFNVADPTNIIPLDFTGENIGTGMCIEVKSNIAYVGCSGGPGSPRFATFDITDPNNIVFLDNFGSPLSNVMSIRVYGNLAYTASNVGRLTILNVENPADIQLVGTYITTNLANGTADVIVKDNYAYVTSTLNNRICIFDVSNPASVVAKGFITEGLHAPQSLGMMDQKMIVQCYGDHCIKVYDLSIPGTPQLVHTLYGFGKAELRYNVQDNFVYSVSTSTNNPLAVIEWTHLPEFRNLVLQPDGTTRFESVIWQRDSLGNAYKLNGKVGIGVVSPTSALHIAADDAFRLSGNMKIDSSNTLEFGSGVSGKQVDAGKIGYNTFSGDALDIVGAGQLGTRKLKFYAEGGSQFDGSVFISQNLGIGNSNPTAPLHLSGNMKIDQYHTIEFGAGLAGKYVDAGKIGYMTFSDGLDIVGAGTNNTNRKINFYNEGGANFTGKILANNDLQVNGKTKLNKLTVQDSVMINAHTKMNGNLLVNNGWVGIGNSAPTVPLHLSGLMKIDGANTLEFGAGVTGKQQDAGKIGYQTFSADALDIVGAGPNNNRKLNFYAEGGSLFSHSIQVNQNILVNGYIGIGLTNPNYRLDVNGRIRVRHLGASAGIFFNGSNNIENGFIGMQNDSLMGMYSNLNGTWGFLMNTQNNRIGIGNIIPLATLHVNGNAKIQSQYTVEFGAGLPGKHPDAGKIGYNAITPDALDIIGAGAAPGVRKVKISDVLQVEKIQPTGWLDVSSSFQNGWSNYNNGFATAAITKDQLGVVRFRGTIHGGSIVPGTTIFTLQPEYRPTYGKLAFMIPNDNTFARLEIQTTGEVIFFGANNASLSLDQISFRVD